MPMRALGAQPCDLHGDDRRTREWRTGRARRGTRPRAALRDLVDTIALVSYSYDINAIGL